MRPALLFTVLLIPTLGCGGWFAAPCTGGLEHRSACTGPHTFQTCRAPMISPQWKWEDERCPGEQVCANTRGDSYRRSTCVDELLQGGCPDPSRVCMDDATLQICETTRSGQGYWRTAYCRHGCGEVPIGLGCRPPPDVAD